ncbi:MAG: B12-binding domain-containing protein, partial [Chloroflexi bacterium]|nr:B12-binding domain-containing protein [Chloroflexota bacterium]
MGKELVNAIANMQEDEAMRLVRDAVAKNQDPNAILADCQTAMQIIGDKYEKEECFLPELIMSGIILKNIS